MDYANGNELEDLVADRERRVLALLHRVGACRDADPALFYPEKGQNCFEAKAICGVCPVIATCREYSLMYVEKYGVWGGLSERERRVARSSNRGRYPLRLSLGSKLGA